MAAEGREIRRSSSSTAEGERGQGGAAAAAAGNLLTGGEEKAATFAAQARGRPGAGDCVPPGSEAGLGGEGERQRQRGTPKLPKPWQITEQSPRGGQHGPAGSALGPSTAASGRVEQAHPCGERRSSRPWGHPSWHGPRGGEARGASSRAIPPRYPGLGGERDAGCSRTGGGTRHPPSTARSRDWHRRFVFSHSPSVGGRTGSPAVRGGP